MHWKYTAVPEDKVNRLSESISVSKTLAGLLVRLGIEDANEAQKFLYPRLSHLEDPFKLHNMDAAVKRVLRAVDNKENIMILGDYDVDGVTSTTLLTTALRHLGLNPKYIIPRRLDEGYGFSQEAINRALESTPIEPSLFIALDCGTNSANEVSFLRKKNIDVIIIDHHQSKESHPEGAILINPHANEVNDAEDSPWKNLCTVGLVFKLIHAIYRILKEDNHPKTETFQLKDMLDLVALGTVADLVPLLDENRILTYFGLGKIQHNNRPGMQALCKVSGLIDGQPVKPTDIAFRLGPRINASGRLSDATLPVDMLLGQDFTSCTRAAEQLNTMNRERQDIEKEVTEEAALRIEKSGDQDASAIVTYDPSWHSGVVGIVAGKLTRLHNRPAVVLAKEGRFAKGSGRSIPGINLVEALSCCAPLLESWGGHPMAAGITLPAENIEAFKVQFMEAVSKQMTAEHSEPILEISSVVCAEELTESLLEEMELLHPFGMCNPEPIFVIENAVLTSPAKKFSNDHIKFQVNKSTGLPLTGIGWKMSDNMPPSNTPVNLAVKYAYNHWNGRKIPQLELIDWKLPPAQ